MKNSEVRKKGTSIARKLYGMLVAKLISAFLLMDILVAGGAVGGYIYYQELEHYGTFERDITIRLEGTPEDELNFIMTHDGSEVVTEDITLLTNVGRKVGFIILSIQGISLLCAISFDYFRVKGRLRPLYQIAENAENMASLALDESKFQNLEYAISHVSPESPNDHVITNDKDLQGIEASLNSLIDRMRESARQQGRFVSDASHELRTPIAVIKGYVDILDRWGKDDQQVLAESIAAIKNESDHMNKLVEQLLFLARGDSGRQQMTMERFSLSEMMQEVYDESVMIDEKHQYEFLKETADILAFGDISMLKQSVRILIDNAAKYTNEGDTITLRVGMNKDYHPFVSVQDNGIGMSSSDVSHIFERFYRSDTARNSSTGGTGLGLSIAKWIIDRHHGVIEVISREGIGTRFTLVLNTNESA